MVKRTSRWPAKSSRAAPKQVSKTFRILNELGLHARAAAAFVKVAARYRAGITVHKGKLEVNGKSIMGVLMLAASRGSTVRVTARGEDAAQALEELGRLIRNSFGEP